MGLFSGAQRRQFERLTRPLLKPLYQTALRMTRQTEWAEDLTQDTLIRAYERFEMFKTGTNFRAWLFTILTHNYLNDCERAKRRPLSTSIHTANENGEAWDFPSGDVEGDPQAALLTNILPERLQEALDSLPDDFRLAVLLVDMEDLPYQDAADALRLPVGTIRSRVSRGRMLLRRYLERGAGKIRS
jgi:RNA polymerase sigma-70 factor (ECF subfamily)